MLKHCPRAKLIRLDGAPVVGAVILGMEAAGFDGYAVRDVMVRNRKGNHQMKIGYAQNTITPSLDKPVYLAGFGNDRRAQTIHDDLYARALAIQTEQIHTCAGCA